MPKILCDCGYVHDLSPIPDNGYVVIKDKDYETLVDLESTRIRLSNAEQGTKDWEELISCDRKVIDYIERLYECPLCGQLFWVRNNRENCKYKMLDIFTMDDLRVKSYDDLCKGIDELINIWCERRCLKGLRYILKGWPLISGLTDELAQLMISLQDIQAFAKSELKISELEFIQNCEVFLYKAINKRK